MDRILVLFLLFFPLLSYADITGRVVGVSDGDTLTVLDSSYTQHKVRLLGIDAPEKRQAFGEVSKRNLSSLVFGKTVFVESSKSDRYKRVLGKIIYQGKDINLEQVKAGLAWHYKRYQNDQMLNDRLAYSDAEENARNERKGLWSDSYSVAPWEWRKAN